MLSEELEMRNSIKELLLEMMNPALLEMVINTGKTLSDKELNNEVDKVLTDVIKDKIDYEKSPISFLMPILCKEGKVKELKFLLDKGLSPNSRFNSHVTLMHCVISNGDLDMLKLLIEKGANISEKIDQKNILDFAAEHGRADMVKFLMNKKINFSNYLGRTKLHWLSMIGDTELIAKYLKNGNVNVNARDILGTTPLMNAVTYGREEAVSLLLSCGADPNIVDHDGATALQVAICVGDILGCTTENTAVLTIQKMIPRKHYEIFKLLIEKGANVHKVKKDGYTALKMLLNMWKKRELDSLTSEYRKKDSRIFSSDIINRCLRVHAEEEIIWSKKNMLGALNLLLEQEEFPLHIACENNIVGAVWHFIKKGENVNKKNADGNTPLYLACINGCFTTVNGLLLLNDVDLTLLPDNIYKRIKVKEIRDLLREKMEKRLVDFCRDGDGKKVCKVLNINERIGDEVLVQSINVATDDVLNILVNRCSAEKIDKVCRDVSDDKIEFVVNRIYKRKNILMRSSVLKALLSSKIHEELEHACKLGDKNSVKELLDTGVDVSENILNMVKRRGIKDIVKLLCDYGAKDSIDRNNTERRVRNKDEGTIADKKGMLLELIKLKDRGKINKWLNNNEGFVDSVYENGRSALICAVKVGDGDIVKIFVEMGAKINHVDIDGKSVLMYAVDSEEKELVNFLIESGADVNLVDKKGRNALMYAIKKNNKDIVVMLINNGGDVRCIDDDGVSVLMYLLEKGKELSGLVDSIKSEERVLINDKSGNSTLFYACKGGHEGNIRKVMNLLPDKGVSDMAYGKAMDILYKDSNKGKKATSTRTKTEVGGASNMKRRSRDF